ncbi:MAG: glycosyltransferase family 2 protein, partial [Anaerolineae bacterium]
MKTPATVAVVIANWNGRSWLQQCLPTLAAQTFKDFSIIVVDNGSTDGSTTWLAENWPEVKLLPQKKNLGFATANNIGIRATKSPFVVLLNNDTLVDPGWLEALLTAVSEPDVGMAASCIVRWNQPDQLDSAGIVVDKAGIAWNRGWGQPATLASKPCFVFGPSAAAALYRRDMLDDIGLFDEDYFAYYEDVDLAWRAQRAGWHCRYTPDARVRHWHSATALKTPNYKNFLNGRNKIWTILKNYDWPALLWASPVIIAY